MRIRLRPTWRASLTFGTVLVVAVTGAGPTPAIAGGAKVVDGEMSFVARVDMGQADQSCTGVLVHPQVVLTAAACFAGADGKANTGVPPQATTVTVGRADISAGGGAVSEVTGIVVHPQQDLALARLATTVTSVTPVAIASTAPAAGDPLILAGFGRTTKDRASDQLKAAKFTVKSVKAATVDAAPSGSTTVGACEGDAAVVRRCGAAATPFNSSVCIPPPVRPAASGRKW